VYLLDSNVCIRLLNQRCPSIEKHFHSLDPSDIKLCSIVKAELLYGARHSRNVDANLQCLKMFFSPLESLPFNDRCAEEYGVIRADLSNLGCLIGPNDLLIASIARAYDLVLITHNFKEFGRVAGLRLDDWEQ